MLYKSLINVFNENYLSSLTNQFIIILKLLIRVYKSFIKIETILYITREVN